MYFFPPAYSSEIENEKYLCAYALSDVRAIGSGTVSISARRCVRRHERVTARSSARSKSLVAVLHLVLLVLVLLVLVLHEEEETNVGLLALLLSSSSSSSLLLFDD